MELDCPPPPAPPAAAGGRGTPVPLGPNNLECQCSVRRPGMAWTSLISPQSISNEHGARCEDAQGGVVLLGHQLQVVGVLPLPLGPSVLKPNFDLKKILSFPRLRTQWSGHTPESLSA